MTMTIEHLLTVSHAFEGRKVMLTRALIYMKASQQSYARYLQLNKLVCEQREQLASLQSYRLYPLVNQYTINGLERKAAIAKKWSERLFKKGNDLMFTFLMDQSYNKLF